MIGRAVPVVAAAALLLLFTGCGALIVGYETPLPDAGWAFYTGGGNVAGDFYLGVVDLVHPDKALTVTLVAMTHIADPSFYEEVQKEIDGADLVLAEGVRGAISVSPTLLVLPCAMCYQQREVNYQELVHQREGLEYRANWRGGDLTMGEFQQRMPWWTPFTQAVLIPAVILFSEPRNFIRWSSDLVAGLLGGKDALEARRRHECFYDMDGGVGSENPLHELCLPGVITERNAHLLAQIDAASARYDMGRIAVPWGAGHLPGIEAALRDRGFEARNHRWIRAVTVRTLLDEGLAGENRPWDFMIPWVVGFRKFRSAWSLSLLCDAIHLGDEPIGYDVKLLWTLLLSASGNGNEGHFQLLPSIFGRPLLFEWFRRGSSTRVRFLLFFQIGSL